MSGLSEKVYLSLPMPTDEDSRSDQLRIRQALEAEGYEHITFTAAALRGLYPLCRECDYKSPHLWSNGSRDGW